METGPLLEVRVEGYSTERNRGREEVAANFFHGRVEPHYRAVPRLPSSQSTALHCRPLAGRSAAYRRWQFPSTRTGPGGGTHCATTVRVELSP
eukprot:746970-Hanusia_phi.AAC.1